MHSQNNINKILSVQLKKRYFSFILFIDQLKVLFYIRYWGCALFFCSILVQAAITAVFGCLCSGMVFGEVNLSYLLKWNPVVA